MRKNKQRRVTADLEANDVVDDGKKTMNYRSFSQAAKETCLKSQAPSINIIMYQLLG
jgi:hypothetical protein